MQVLHRSFDCRCRAGGRGGSPRPGYGSWGFSVFGRPGLLFDIVFCEKGCEGGGLWHGWLADQWTCRVSRFLALLFWLVCVTWRDLGGGVGWAMGLRVIQAGISDLGTRFSGLAVCWYSEDFVSSGQPESLILAQNERWRHA